MNRLLVAYASKNGSTAEIAEAVADGIRSVGHEVDCTPVSEVPSLDAYDAVVIGSAVYLKRWRGDAKRFFNAHQDELAQLPFWLFSSGPTGDPADDDPAWFEPAKIMRKAKKLGVREHVVFGGKIAVDGGGRMARSMAAGVPEEFRDRRDWPEIRAWARKVAADLGSG